MDRLKEMVSSVKSVARISRVPQGEDELNHSHPDGALRAPIRNLEII